MTQRGTPDLLGLLRNPATLAQLSLREWDDTLRLARSANLMGRIAEAVLSEKNLLSALPPQVQPHILATARLTQHQQQAIQWECRHLESALGSLGLPLVLLKGAAYALSGHPAARGRLFGDVDLLVPHESLTAVEAALRLHGWTSGKLDPYDQRYYREWMHELPPMVNLKRSTVVDVHHNILPRTARHMPDAGKLLEASLPIAGSRLRVLAPSDMVIHSATHLFHEGELKNGLRDLHDLDALFTSFSRADGQFWQALIERSIELKLTWPVLLAMRYCERLLQTPVPSSAMEAAKRAAGLSALRLALLDAMYLPAFKPDHPLVANTRSQLARAALYLRGHALRMPLWQLSVHLGRKAVLRLFKHSSRRV